MLIGILMETCNGDGIFNINNISLIVTWHCIEQNLVFVNLLADKTLQNDTRC